MNQQWRAYGGALDAADGADHIRQLCPVSLGALEAVDLGLNPRVRPSDISLRL